MEKTPRYTQRERNMVLGFAAQYKDIIENKRTDAESNRKKDEVWRVIAKEFNSRVYHQRTSKQLRQLYKNMKLLLKKDLSIDGRTKDFMDILNALSQQSVLNPFISYRQNMSKSEYDDEHEREQKGTSSSITSDQVENDVVVIKSEELSDNEQSSSVRNDMNDDTMSNKDIPEICMEEDDEYLNDMNNDSFNRQFNGHHINNNNSQMGLLTGSGGGGGGGGMTSPSPLNYSHHHNHNRNNNNNNNENCNSLIQLAIEERKRKIDLLNAQIEYWKALTRKLENTNSTNSLSSPSSTATAAAGGAVATTTGAGTGTGPTNSHCHCHLPPRINGINQS